MPDVIAVVGLPGSGKTTYIQKYWSPGQIVLSGDDIRGMFHAGTYVYEPDLEPLILDTIVNLARQFRWGGFQVIIDEASLTHTELKRQQLEERLGSITYWCFDVPVEECKKRRKGTRGCDNWDEVIDKFNAELTLPLSGEEKV